MTCTSLSWETLNDQSVRNVAFACLADDRLDLPERDALLRDVPQRESPNLPELPLVTLLPEGCVFDSPAGGLPVLILDGVSST